jgi:enoyl-CoA hydratase
MPVNLGETNENDSSSRQAPVRTWKRETVGYIEISRASKANAYNHEVLEGLKVSLEQMEAERDVRVLVITGAGNRSFCAGADLDEMKKKDFTDALNLESGKIFASIAAFPKVVLAAINGAARSTRPEIHTWSCHHVVSP